MNALAIPDPEPPIPDEDVDASIVVASVAQEFEDIA